MQVQKSIAQSALGMFVNGGNILVFFQCHLLRRHVLCDHDTPKLVFLMDNL